MALRHTLLIAPLVFAFTACETAQENPNYQYSSTYGQRAPQALAQNSRNPSQVQTAPVRYVTPNAGQSAPHLVQASTQTVQPGSYTRVNHDCLNQERRRSVIGAGIGGTVGAIAGKKLVGGTKGTLIGAAAGGVAGYGIGDQTIKCEPVTVQAPIQQAVITPAYNPPATIQTAPIQAASVQTTVPNAPLPQISAEPVSAADYTPSLTENSFSSDTVGTPGFEAMQQSQSLAPTAPQFAQVAPAPQIAAPQITAPQNAQPSAPVLPAVTPPAAPLWPQSQTQIGGQYIVQPGDTVYSLSRRQCTTVTAVQSINNIDQNFSIKAGQSIQLPASQCL